MSETFRSVRDREIGKKKDRGKMQSGRNLNERNGKRKIWGKRNRGKHISLCVFPCFSLSSEGRKTGGKRVEEKRDRVGKKDRA